LKSKSGGKTAVAHRGAARPAFAPHPFSRFSGNQDNRGGKRATACRSRLDSNHNAAQYQQVASPLGKQLGNRRSPPRAPVRERDRAKSLECSPPAEDREYASNRMDTPITKWLFAGVQAPRLSQWVIRYADIPSVYDVKSGRVECAFGRMRCEYDVFQGRNGSGYRCLGLPLSRAAILIGPSSLRIVAGGPGLSPSDSIQRQLKCTVSWVEIAVLQT